MPFNGSGTYNLPGAALVTGGIVDATEHNTFRNDIATALTDCITRDGQSPATANIPLGGFKITGLAAGTTNGDAIRYEQLASAVQAQSETYFTTGGTSTAYTLTPLPALSALAAGQRFRVIFHTASGATPTLAISGLTAKNLKVYDGAATKQAITSADVPTGWVSDVEYDGTDYVVLNPASRAIASVAQDFRLTLTSGTPVTTADVVGATTIYCTPLIGNKIGLYNGTTWINYTSAEFSHALGTLTASLPYDVFCYQNAGVPTLEFLAWTSGIARATALAYNSGILIKSGDATRRYLGTFYTTATTTTEDSEANRYLFNYYHRKPKPMRVKTTTASWTIANTVTTFIQANSSTAYQLNCLIGVVEDSICAEVNATYTTLAGTGSLIVGIGINSTSTSLAPYGRVIGTTSYGMAQTSYKGYPVLGINNITWLNMGNGSDTVAVSNYNAGNWQSQMQGEVRL